MKSDVHLAAIHLLASREHSSAELRRKLSAKDFPEAEIDDVLASLEQEGLLSNERYAECYVRSRINKGYGPLHIQAQLRERGIDSTFSIPLIKPNDAQWLDSARAAQRKRFGEGLPTDLRERARQARFLQQRGFTAEQIKVALQPDRQDRHSTER